MYVIMYIYIYIYICKVRLHVYIQLGSNFSRSQGARLQSSRGGTGAKICTFWRSCFWRLFQVPWMLSELDFGSLFGALFAYPLRCATNVFCASSKSVFRRTNSGMLMGSKPYCFLILCEADRAFDHSTRELKIKQMYYILRWFSKVRPFGAFGLHMFSVDAFNVHALLFVLERKRFIFLIVCSSDYSSLFWELPRSILDAFWASPCGDRAPKSFNFAPVELGLNVSWLSEVSGVDFGVVFACSRRL